MILLSLMARGSQKRIAPYQIHLGAEKRASLARFFGPIRRNTL
ncbi:hypothetical protein RHODOSMS8_02930 [Rhodobiaceae bacterium]|nr:hypothetical protein RHODOSMS8_02930 [Rhodobiaceae bacterium]